MRASQHKCILEKTFFRGVRLFFAEGQMSLSAGVAAMTHAHHLAHYRRIFLHKFFSIFAYSRLHE